MHRVSIYEGRISLRPPVPHSRLSTGAKPRGLLLMQAEGAIVGCNVGDRMLVNENVPLDFQKDGEIVERLYISFHLVA